MFNQSHRKFDSGENLCFGKRQNRFMTYKSKEKTEFARKREDIKKKSQSKGIDVRFGNYHQYYGYRNQGQTDSRLLCMKKEWFEGRDVLDVGCNAGHFTLSLAKQFSPRSIVGVDIDGVLIKMAMKNVRHYFTSEDFSAGEFPLSTVLSYGPVAASLDPRGRYPCKRFPFNVQFLQCNFVFPEAEMLEWAEPYFDTVLCLSVTKWVHLNWGDRGIRMLFLRCHAQLRPGGHMILEAQDFSSYARKKKLNLEFQRNYQNIQLIPEMFNEYLLDKVGFEKCELIDVPAHSSKGFSRPIYLFTKHRELEPPVPLRNRHVIYEDSDCEYSDVEPLSE